MLVSAQEFLAESEIIIDVRSPSEYALSHIPNALNLAVLNDAQRHRIGTLYKQNPFSAKMLGASLICENIARFLPQLESLQITPAKIIGIHCARGGMRSLSLQSILQNIGFRTLRLKNGYKAYRNEVLGTLAKPPKMSFFTLIGPTGCGKSELIVHFKNSLDIESFAKHLGSSFGGILGTQPSAGMFENLLFTRLKELENMQVLVEGESKKLGALVLPNALYNAYQNGVKILVSASLELRIKRIAKVYSAIDSVFFNQAMQKIAPFMRKDFWLQAKSAYERGDLECVAEILITHYYDKVYRIESHAYEVDSSDLDFALKQIKEVMVKCSNIPPAQ